MLMQRILLLIALFGTSIFPMRTCLGDVLDAEKVEAQIFAGLKEIDRLNIPVIVSYSLGNRPPIVREFGRLKDDGIPAAHTQVDLLSITKSITAISILKLVERNALKLTDMIGQIFEGVPSDKAAINIHQLLTHTSGLFSNCGGDHEPTRKDELLRCVFNSKLLSAPGTEHRYSNVGYSVLAAVVEEKSQKVYEEFLLEDVLAGTGLVRTGYSSVIDEALTIRSMNSDELTDASWGGEKPYWNLIGNGGLVSTADEFVRFRQALANGRVISLDLLEAAQSAHVPEDAEGTSFYGYGVVIWEKSAVGPVIWHNGGSDVFSSEWVELEDYDLILFVAGFRLDDANAYSAVEILWRHLKLLKQ